MDTRGTHLLAELHGCAPDRLDSVEAVREAMLRAAELAGCTVLYTLCHAFEPQGVTGLLLIAESHLSVHTWPEHGYAAVDLFTCGTAATDTAIDALGEALGATRVERLSVERGTGGAPTPRHPALSTSR